MVTEAWIPVQALPDERIGVEIDGEYVVDWDAIRAAHRAKTMAQIRLAERYSIGGQRLTNRTFEAFDPTENPAAFEAAKMSATLRSAGLWLHGNVGAGKTHLLAAIVAEHRKSGTPAILTTVERILSAIKSTFDADGDSLEERVKAEIATCPVLAIDDLGKEHLTPWATTTFFAIINTRYEAGLPILLSSNLGPRELAAQRYARAIEGDPNVGIGAIDRLREMAGTIIEMTGSSHRGSA